ncbi:hypothetical protein [Bifidobacterium apri]|uniref:Uncharacterized protein n=2 Tax=Bifidobacterium apri TaxID=1769423 RepID=A0A6A2V7E6_9BIFI|nr:hypothetical protein DSM100238_1608 [Bifidobacterium apri]
MGGLVTARDKETAASEGFVPRAAAVRTRRGAGADCMLSRFILVFALLCGMILPLGGCSVDTGTTPEDFSKAAREHGMTVKDLGDSCSNAAEFFNVDLSRLRSGEITFGSCSLATVPNNDEIVVVYLEALDPIDAKKSLSRYKDDLKSDATGLTSVPNGLEFSDQGYWGGVYVKRYSILFTIANNANKDLTKEFSRSMGYGVKSIDSHDLVRPGCYVLAFFIGVISYVWKMFRQKRQAAKMARLAWQQQATAPSMPVSPDLSQAQFGTFQPQYPVQPQYAGQQQFLPQPQADEPMREQPQNGNQPQTFEPLSFEQQSAGAQLSGAQPLEPQSFAPQSSPSQFFTPQSFAPQSPEPQTFEPQTFFPQPSPDQQSSALQLDVSSQDAGSAPDAPQLFEPQSFTAQPSGIQPDGDQPRYPDQSQYPEWQ